MSQLTFFRSLLFLLVTFLLVACTDDATSSNAAGNGQSSGALATELFTSLTPEATGIDFVNEVKNDFEFNYTTYAYIFNGAGVGVIDYDVDGLPDLFFVSNQGANKLYHNLGDWSFEDVSEKAGITAPGDFTTGVSIADVNADGLPDIYLSRTGKDNDAAGSQNRKNLLFINQGDGAFLEEAERFGLASDRPGIQATFFDYDGDGDLDCYQLNAPTSFNTVNKVRVSRNEDGRLQRVMGPVEAWESDQLFRNDGGRFVDVTAAAGLSNRSYGLSTAIHDFNQDGRPDLYVANDYIEPDNLYLNQTDGGFKDVSFGYFRHSSHSSMGSDIADVNNDGLLDLVVLDMLAEDLVRQKSLENGMRSDRYNTLAATGYGHQLMRNQLQVNNGANFGFSEYGELAGIAATDWSWAPLLADFDNDRLVDLFVSNGFRYDVGDLDFMAYTSDSVRAAGGVTTERFASYDDYLSLIPSKPLPNYLYRNEGELHFSDVAAEWNLGEPSFSSSAVYADLDQDGDLDLVVGNHERPPFVYRNEAVESGQGGNWLQITAVGGRANPQGIGLQVTAVVGAERLVRELYPVRGFLGSTELLLHFGLGKIERVDRLEVRWPDGKTQLFTDVAANQRLEVKQADAGRQTIAGSAGAADAGAKLFSYPREQRGISFRHVENEFDDFNRQFLQPRMLSREGPALAKGDINGDGLTDLFFGGAADQSPALYLQDKSGNFRAVTNFLPTEHAAYEDVAAGFYDVDGDGDLDLYVVSGGNAFPNGSTRYQDRLYRNDGKGNFTHASGSLPRMPTSTASLAALDYDADGDLDFLVGGRTLPGRYPEAPRSYLLRNDAGKFQDVSAEVFPDLTKIGMVTTIAIGDLNGDGQPAVVIAGEWMPISVFEFRGGTFQPVPGPANSHGNWHSLLVEDLDGDGKAEIVAGNDGLNCRYHPSPEQPVLLYADDFDDNGAIDPILTVADADGRQVPLVTKAQMIKQLPGLRKQFTRTRQYARADINDFFPQTDLEEVPTYRLETMATTIFSVAGGQWSATQLPTQAQASPVQAIRSADFNDDGRKDLLLLGNDYGLQVETGRMDAGNGTLLLNTGNDEWEVVANRHHGFWASLDARGLERIALADGKTGWVIVNNSGPAAIYLEE